MNKHDDLIFASLLHDFFIRNFVHELETLNSFALGDANVLLFEGARAIGGVKIKEALVRFDPEKCSNVFVIRQGRTQPDQSNHFLRRLDLPDCAADDGLEDWPSLVVKKVNLINNDQLHELGVGTVAALAGHNVPFFGSGHDDLRF